MADATAVVGERRFSLLSDESSDISVHKYSSMAIIYHIEAKGKNISTFPILTELDESYADAIVGSLKGTLEYFGLNFNKLRGIGTDNASVVVGVNNGVYKRLNGEVPSLVLVRCVCHSFQLTVSAAAAEALPRNVELVGSETYNCFSRSSTRQLAYNKLYNLISDNHNQMKIVQSSQTRWLSIANAVEKFAISG